MKTIVVWFIRFSGGSGCIFGYRSRGEVGFLFDYIVSSYWGFVGFVFCDFCY